ncbi:alpha-amylase [Nocardioides gansuensis]|uniref:Alpha-amylase n=1 Tax=Nocardioides gansuensis TaxID=2138300 RepID=A0A2T8F719_9ACTN|nr:amylosucrase [Nocardioides gansuensis]PVG81506.1 alpha-amylase [Nocardioides gansuensis]
MATVSKSPEQADVASLSAGQTHLADEARTRLGVLEGEAFLARLAGVQSDLVEALHVLYGDAADVEALAATLVRAALEATASRGEALAVLDRRREVDPTWFLAEDRIGYVCYVDRFAGDLQGLLRHLDHLEALGVRYLHLMPLLRPREGENDGGYAVADYEQVDPRLGTMTDLAAVTAAAHERDIAICTDLVLNHTAREHRWAQAALSGDPTYRRFYRFFPDRGGPEGPDAYERTLSEVFPDFAPGSFSHLPETDEWVWTTFHDYQWDLDWSNPEVFQAMFGVMCQLANQGVDVLRLDAVPFLWKRLGTDGQNQPEAHRILQALKALVRLARPGVVLKAEAIVGPDQLVPYLGAHDVYRPECDLAYDNQLMVMLWSSLATRDARLATQALQRRTPAPDGTGWVTYARCHDDIGWAVADEDARAVGLDPHAHRAFLAAFYAGRHSGSFARGIDFQVNEVTGDARTSGSCASLAGLETALDEGDEQQITAALRRIETLYSVVYSFGGLPLVYMGDELGLLNDQGWAKEESHAADNRWLHRPRMDWEAVGRRHVQRTVEQRCFDAFRALGAARRSLPALRSDAATTVVPVSNPHLLVYVRRHRRSLPLVALVNFSDHAQVVDLHDLPVDGPLRHVHSTSGDLGQAHGQVHLPPWGFAWAEAPLR